MASHRLRKAKMSVRMLVAQTSNFAAHTLCSMLALSLVEVNQAI